MRSSPGSARRITASGRSFTKSCRARRFRVSDGDELLSKEARARWQFVSDGGEKPMTFLSRRHFLSWGVVATGSLSLLDQIAIGDEPAPKTPARPLLYTGGGPARGNPGPHTLKGEDQVKARLTPESWRLEIIADGGAKVEKPRK